MEQLREENHKLMLKLENLKKTHSTELEFLRDEQDLKDREYASNLAKLRDESKSREALKNDKIQALTEELNTLREEHEAQAQVVEKLRHQLDILKSAKSTGACGSYSDYEGLKESNRMLKCQLTEKDEVLGVQTDKIRVLNEQVREFREAVARLNEELEGKDSVVKELHERVKSVERDKEEECGMLQVEVIGLREEVRKLKQGDGDREKQAAGGAGGGSGSGGGGRGVTRGNSLFSEVEERRLRVESELIRLQQLVKKLTEDKRVLKMELERGDTHSATITTQLEVIQKSEQELAREIRKDKSETLQLFDSYSDRLNKLRSEYNRKLQEYKSLHGSSPPPKSSSTTSTELESLRSERDKLQYTKISLERENTDLKRELKYNKHLRTTAEANLKIAKSKIEFNNSRIANASSCTVASPPPTDNNNVGQPEAGVNESPMNMSSQSVVPMQKPIKQTQESCNQQ